MKLDIYNTTRPRDKTKVLCELPSKNVVLYISVIWINLCKTFYSSGCKQSEKLEYNNYHPKIRILYRSKRKRYFYEFIINLLLGVYRNNSVH